MKASSPPSPISHHPSAQELKPEACALTTPFPRGDPRNSLPGRAALVVKRRKEAQRGKEINCSPQTPCKPQRGTKEGTTTHNSSAPSFRYFSRIWFWKESRAVSRKEYDLTKTVCTVRPMWSAAKARLPERVSTRRAGAGTSPRCLPSDGVWPPPERGTFLKRHPQSHQYGKLWSVYPGPWVPKA